MNVHFVSLGCPKNRVDTEVMLGHTTGAGHQLVDRPKPPRSSSSTPAASSAKRSRSRSTPSWRWRATSRPGPASASSSPAASLSAIRKSWPSEMPEVDQFLGTNEVGEIAKAISGGIARLAVADTPAYLYDDAAPRRRSQAAYSTYVKIAEGCDRPCAFCIIPKLRGPQRSRSQSVVREARDLAAGGTKEICLVAQDLTTYGTDLPEARRTGAPRLASLLRALGEVDGIEWIRLHYAYPDRLHRRAARRHGRREAGGQDTSTCPSSTSTAACSRPCAAATASGRYATSSNASGPAWPAGPSAPPSSPAIPARPTPRSSGSATSCAKPSSITSASSTSRARKGPWPPSSPSASRKRDRRPPGRASAHPARDLQEEAARHARADAARARRGSLRRVRVPPDGPPRRPGARDRRPGVSLLVTRRGRGRAARPGTFVRPESPTPPNTTWPPKPSEHPLAASHRARALIDGWSAVYSAGRVTVCRNGNENTCPPVRTCSQTICALRSRG